MEAIELPSRHGEGRFLTADDTVRERLEQDHLIAVRYVDAEGRPTETWPDNPNGSPGAVAGLCDPSGRLFGLMPHPDAFLYGFQHPQAFRRGGDDGEPAEGAGLRIFRNGVDAAAGLA
jgi:phosphoribosylformylglycinamidine synthase